MSLSLRPLLGDEPKLPPNIVFILADDLGWTDLACYGSNYHETPNIDKLARNGMTFTAAYACPNCQPTRAALMSGQHGVRTGVYTVGGTSKKDTSKTPLVPIENVPELPMAHITVADALTKAGYVTGMFGKWHLGNGKFNPRNRGFADTLVSLDGRHFDFSTSPRMDIPKETYLADFLTDHAIKFIETNHSRPFFLYVPHFAVHHPLQAKEELIAKFRNKPGVGGQSNPTYAGMIASVDESVGRIVDKLEELKLSERTLVIFTSDNGGFGGFAAEGLKTKVDTTSNAPLRGGKGMLYEGGVRVPWIARWPTKIKPGTTCGEPISCIDLFPTCLDVAGAKCPDKYPLDGLSMLPLLKGERKLNRPAIYWHFPGYFGPGKGVWYGVPGGAVRAGDYKLIEWFDDRPVELYNLGNDLGEKTNVANAQPDKRDELLKLIHDWRTSFKAAMPAHRN